MSDIEAEERMYNTPLAPEKEVVVQAITHRVALLEAENERLTAEVTALRTALKHITRMTHDWATELGYRVYLEAHRALGGMVVGSQGGGEQG